MPDCSGKKKIVRIAIPPAYLNGLSFGRLAANNAQFQRRKTAWRLDFSQSRRVQMQLPDSSRMLLGIGMVGSKSIASQFDGVEKSKMLKVGGDG